jgi:hypothetical protein
MERDVRPERNGWRDEAISRRHRRYGFHVPAVDLDFVMVEYTSGRPCAIVEYKHFRTFGISPKHPSIVAVRILCDSMSPPIPFLVAIYSERDWTFRVSAMNAAAEPFVKRFGIAWMLEAEFVTLLYALRGDRPPATVLESLASEEATHGT